MRTNRSLASLVEANLGTAWNRISTHPTLTASIELEIGHPNLLKSLTLQMSHVLAIPRYLIETSAYPVKATRLVLV